ncbi:hypothetical protein MWE_0164 [Helicobacter pylori XZ274]|nr:hypothetical protein MWE_0164 [Helicobacter pylori XZ274]
MMRKWSETLLKTFLSGRFLMKTCLLFAFLSSLIGYQS